MTDEEDNNNNEESKELSTKSSNPLIVAAALADELKGYDVAENRKEVLTILRDRFVASTMETASQKQVAESLLVEKLIEKIANENMNPNMLLRILEGLSKSNEGAIESILGNKGNGGGGNKGGVDILINAGGAAQAGAVVSEGKHVEEGQEVEHPMKDANQLLEAMNIIAKATLSNKGLVNKNDDIEDVEFKEDDDDS